jgi:hypothetical protein
MNQASSPRECPPADLFSILHYPRKDPVDKRFAPVEVPEEPRFVPLKDCHRVDDDTIDCWERAARIREILTVLATFSDREQEIVKHRYGLMDGSAYTGEELGKKFNVSRGRIQQIEMKAVDKLAEILNRKYAQARFNVMGALDLQRMKNKSAYCDSRSYELCPGVWQQVKLKLDWEKATAEREAAEKAAEKKAAEVSNPVTNPNQAPLPSPKPKFDMSTVVIPKRPPPVKKMRFRSLRDGYRSVDIIRKGLPDGRESDVDLYRLIGQNGDEIPWVGLNLGNPAYAPPHNGFDRLQLCSLESYENGRVSAFLESDRDMFIIVVARVTQMTYRRLGNGGVQPKFTWVCHVKRKT